ncbi:MAG: hypothetical protein ACAI44_35045 [Candidatus Sericytochromatia bacterium]
MKKGILGECVINVDHPKAKELFDTFVQEVRAVQLKQGIDQLICLRRKISPKQLEIVFIAASKVQGKLGDLQSQGYLVSEASSDISALAKNIKSFEFTQTVTFGDKPFAARNSAN